MSCGGGAYTHAACLSAPVVILVPASTWLWLLPACLLALTAGHKLGVESAKAGAFVFDDDGNPISDGKVTGTESERRRDTESHGVERHCRDRLRGIRGLLGTFRQAEPAAWLALLTADSLLPTNWLL